jgi:protein TonB
MTLSRYLTYGVLVALLSWPGAAAAQGGRGTPAPSAPTPPTQEDQIGPLEKRANPVTPENPIPRRILVVAPIYPAELTASGLAVSITLKATLDGSGHVAEARSTAFAFFVQGAANPGGLPPRSQIEPAFRKAALDALRQWLYDIPANAPISLYVQLNFVPGSDATIAWHDPAPPPVRGVTGGVVGGVVGGVPPPPPPPPPPGGAVRVGGNVAAPRKIKDVKPVYPALAESARVQGIVILEATIGADGRVTDARVIRSIPLLDLAAIDAVRQWEFTPTLLNGVPIPIIMSVTVNFTLD